MIPNSPFQIKQKFLAGTISTHTTLVPANRFHNNLRTVRTVVVAVHSIRMLLVGQCDRSVGQSAAFSLRKVRLSTLTSNAILIITLTPLHYIIYISLPCSTLLVTLDCEVRNSFSFWNAIISSHYIMHVSPFVTIQILTSLHNASQLRQRVCQHYPNTTIWWYCKLRWTEDSTSASLMEGRWQSVR